jgi:diguanylate cyclase (GGDEF)-like protein
LSDLNTLTVTINTYPRINFKMASERFFSNLALVALLTLSYFAAGKFGLMLAFVNPSATAVWPPTGIALAAFLLLGNQIWPGILLGAFLVNVTTSSSVPASIGIAVGNTLEGLVGAHLVNRFAHGRQVLNRVHGIFKFLVLAGLLSTTVSATFGVTSLVLNRLAAWADYAPIWLTWWLGDAGGALIVAPVLLLWAMNPRLCWSRDRVLEAVLLLLSSILLGLTVFGGLPPLGTKNYALEFTILPVVVWAALRFGQREAATVTLILSGIAIWGTLHGFGPFARVSPNEALLLLQALMGIMTIMGLGLAAVVAERQQIETAVWETSEKLRHGLNELERRNREMAVLNEMGDRFQSCLTVEEAYTVVTQSVPQLFPNETGALYVMSTSRNLVEATVVWGDHLSAQHMFVPNDCWALRRGRMHLAATSSASLLCTHLTGPAPPASLCLPMIAQGEILGVLHLQSMVPEPLAEAKQQLSQTVANRVALALVNLRLRESLRQQSIRDPLTGLFNRRYLEESLERELRRAIRNHSQVGVILLDLDYFKHFNDTFGHATGDLLLRELGGFLKRCIRGSDIACRYGGEEFLLLLPDTSLETTWQRAEQVREGVKQLQVFYQGGPLGPITLSLGVAAFPQHGPTSEALLQVADSALYRAKRHGRDQVAIAETR